MIEFYAQQPLQFSPGQCPVCRAAITSVLFVSNGRRVFVQIEPIELMPQYSGRNSFMVPVKPRLSMYEHRHANYTQRGPHEQPKDSPQTA